MSMNIIVCAKQIIDISEMKVDPNTNKPILEGVPKKVNDIDKNAVEEAIKIRDENGGKITSITVGDPDAKERIKELLAMGVDEGILIPYPEHYDYHVVSKIIAEAIKKIGQYDIILCGEASVDLFSGQVGPKIAGFLNIPQLTYALRINSEKDKLTAERNMGDKLITSESTYPVLITVTKEINEPRLPSLMQILGAANKPIHDWTFDSIIDNIKSIVETIEIKGISMERKNIVYKDDIDESVQQLVNNLAKDGFLG